MHEAELHFNNYTHNTNSRIDRQSLQTYVHKDLRGMTPRDHSTL